MLQCRGSNTDMNCLLDRMLLGLEKINDLLVNQLKSRPYRWFSSVDFLNFVNNCSLHMTQRTVKFETRFLEESVKKTVKRKLGHGMMLHWI